MLMELDLTKLNNNEKINLDEEVSFDLKEYPSKEIIDLSSIHVIGEVFYNASDNLEINLNIKGEMTLKDSITLEPLSYPIDINISEEYDLNDKYLEEYYEKEQNILDIKKILWENIVLEVPMRLTKSDKITLSGDGWSFGEKENKNDNIDPRLAKLQELLSEREE